MNTAGKREKNVVPFDFRRQSKFTRDHVRALQIVHETFARQLSTVLATTLRSAASCTFSKVEQLSYDEYIRSLPNPSYMIILSMNPLPGAALIQFPLPITFAAIDRLLGGTAESLSPKRALTEIESNLMRTVIERALRELEYAYESLVRIEADIVQQEFNPQFAQIAAPSDMTFVVGLEVRIGDKRGTATICIPFATLQPVLETLASQTLFQDTRSYDPAEWERLLERALNRVAVELSVRFDTVSLTSSDIVDLEVGDVVPLSHPVDKPLTVLVDGINCYQAVSGRRGKRLACLIVGTEGE
ncbi:MAG: flagellar motor switch protein FliM [Actinomycetota bacterium]|nr:flagellar motor switch protein FliM [Actinomycetota bacterium]